MKRKNRYDLQTVVDIINLMIFAVLMPYDAGQLLSVREGRMANRQRALVTGAGGFIGSHLVNYLSDRGYWVRGVDIKESEFLPLRADEFELLDLRRWGDCLKAVSDGIDEVYNLAANMGGIGFIDAVHAEVMHDNVLINTHMIEAARQKRVGRHFYSSSACVYPRYLQHRADSAGLKESDVYPAEPDSDYGWEKLYTERMCEAYRRDYGFASRVARLHNVYGPCGAWIGGREKAPAAMCRKVAEAVDGDTIEIWGDGSQTRSFCYIDDALEGIFRLMHSDFWEPLNIGSQEQVTIDGLADIVIGVAGKSLKKTYAREKPQGVRGRSSDNTLIRRSLGWAPETSLRAGIARTYPWIAEQVARAGQVRALSR